MGSTEVAMLHRVSECQLEPGPYDEMTVSPEELESYLESRRYLDRGSWRKCLNSNDSKSRFFLTFDDGYAGFKQYVLPLIEKHNVHAVVFITTEFVEGRLEPFQALAARMINNLSGNEPISHETLAKLYQRLSFGSVIHRQKKIRELSRLLGIEIPEVYQGVYMDWDEVKRLHKHPLVTIGAHTKTHPRLTRVGPNQLAQELKGARNEIEDKIGSPPELLAYPHGANNSLVRIAARYFGYKYAFTTQPRNHLAHEKTPFRLPRKDIKTLL